MKKILLLALLFAAVSCAKEAKWTMEQKEKVKNDIEKLREHRFLSEMTNDEFDQFTIIVVDSLSNRYPDFNTFVAMPAIDDSVTMVVISTVAYDLGRDHANMRRIFPYHDLKLAGILPDGLNHDQLVTFYSCLSGKVLTSYGTMLNFLIALASTELSVAEQVVVFENQCAMDLATQMAVEMQITE